MPQLQRLCSRAQEPPLLKPEPPTARALKQERPPQPGGRALQGRAARSQQLARASTQQQRPRAAQDKGPKPGRLPDCPPKRYAQQLLFP